MKPTATINFTDAKLQLFAELESTIAQKLMVLSSVAQDLTIIRDNKLYPAYLTFNDYARDRWGFGEPEITKMLDVIAVIGDLSSDPITKTLFPIHDEQIKEFSNLTRLERIELAKKVVTEIGNGMLTTGFIHLCKLELFPHKCSESNLWPII
jgi:hypothetical protein